MGVAGIIISNYNQNKRDLTKLQLDNIKALTDDENPPIYFRVDEDCSYTIKAAVGSTVKILIGGVEIGTIKIGGNGQAEYIYSKGATHCYADGNEMCIQRYCPTISAINS